MNEAAAKLAAKAKAAVKKAVAAKKSPAVPASAIPVLPAALSTSDALDKDMKKSKEASEESKAGLRRMLVTKPVATKPVATKPVVTKPVATKPVVTKPVVTKPVATKPVVTKPAVAPKPVAVISGELPISFVGMTEKPTGIAEYKEGLEDIRERFTTKIKKRMEKADEMVLWGRNRVQHFSGACKKIDAILIPKYATKSAKLKKLIVNFLKTKMVVYKAKLAKMLKRLVGNALLTNKWRSGLKLPLEDMIKAGVEEAKSHPIGVLKFQKVMKTKWDAKMKHKAAEKAKKEKHQSFIDGYEMAKKAANIKIDTHATIKHAKKVEKKEKADKKKLGELIVKKMGERIEVVKKHHEVAKDNVVKKVKEAKELPKKAFKQAKEVAEHFEGKAKEATKKIATALKKGDTQAAKVAEKEAKTVAKVADEAKDVAKKVVAVVQGAIKKVPSKPAPKVTVTAKTDEPTEEF